MIDEKQGRTKQRIQSAKSNEMNHERQTDGGDEGPRSIPTNQQEEAAIDRPPVDDSTQHNPTRISVGSQNLDVAGPGDTQQTPQHLHQFAQLQQFSSTPFHGLPVHQAFQQQFPPVNPLASYMNLQQQLPLQFSLQQSITEQNLSMTMMGQQPSAGMGSYFAPPPFGGGFQLPTFAHPLSYAVGNPAAISPSALGFTIFPCKSRGMPKDHNPQVSVDDADAGKTQDVSQLIPTHPEVCGGDCRRYTFRFVSHFTKTMCCFSPSPPPSPKYFGC